MEALLSSDSKSSNSTVDLPRFDLLGDFFGGKGEEEDVAKDSNGEDKPPDKEEAGDGECAGTPST